MQIIDDFKEMGMNIWKKTPVFFKQLLIMTWYGWILVCMLVVLAGLSEGIREVFVTQNRNIGGGIFVIAIFITLTCMLLRSLYRISKDPWL